MLKRYSVILIFTTLIFLVATTAYADKIMSYDGENLFGFYDIEVEKDKMFTLEIMSNPSTGYQWSEYDSLPDGIMYLGDKDIQLNNPQHLAGKSSINRRMYRANKKGMYHFVLQYSRSWETEIPAHKYIIVTVLVN